MQRHIAIILILAATTSQFFKAQIPAASAVFNYGVDLLLGILCPLVIGRIIVRRSWNQIPPKYILLFVGFFVVLVAGIVLNDVQGDTIFAGTRYYLRYFPVFLLPFAYDYDEQDIRVLTRLFLALMLIQIPIVLWQRFIFGAGVVTGDIVTGTFASGTGLVVAGIMGILYVFALFLKNRISATAAVVLALLFILPTSLAEAKAAPLLLGGGILVLLWVSRRSISASKLVGISFASALGFLVFVGLYAALYAPEEGVGYFEVMTDSRFDYHNVGTEDVQFDLNRESRGDLIAKTNPEDAIAKNTRVPGRFDQIVLPFKILFPDDIVRLALGVGIGNMSATFMSGGKYLELSNRLMLSGTSISQLLWETGVLGTTLYITFFLLLYRDFSRYANRSGETGLSLHAFAAFCSIIIASIPYTNFMFLFDVMVPVYFLFALAIASQRRASPKSASSWEGADSPAIA
ncbi:MAG: hypothetical protein H6994_18300 [Pseudomonadales bacterium]|nr:hypothetical protein [Pseudomonadales bacterium]